MADDSQKSSDSVEQSARAAGQAVKMAAKAGKTAAHIATGTAAGGPAGAAIAAAWDAKNVIAKVLIAFLLIFCIIIAPITALPRAFTNPIFGLDGNEPSMTPQESYTAYMEQIDAIVKEAHQDALAAVKAHIQATGGIDVQKSLDSIADYAATTASYDVPYILACYSASMGNSNDVSLEDFVAKLRAEKSSFFSISYETLTDTKTVPVEYPIYTAKQVYGLWSAPSPVYIYPAGSNTPIPVYPAGSSPQRLTVYVRSGTASSDVAISRPAYSSCTYYTVNKSASGAITGYTAHSDAYRATGGTTTYTPTVQTYTYIQSVIGSFNQTALIDAFHIDRDALYSEDSTETVGEVIDAMTLNLRKTLYMTAGTSGGSSNGVSLTDQELINYINNLDCNDTRKYILRTAFSLIGKVSYFWGGKSAAGWNDQWGTPKVVTAAGSPSTGTTRPYGLDCSGFTSWVFKTAYGLDIGSGTSGQWPGCTRISVSELQPGDLAFLPSSKGGWQHVLMFAGWQDGKMMFVHCSSSSGVVLNSPGYIGSLVYGRPRSVDYNAQVPDSAQANVSDSVEAYSAAIEQYADRYGMSQYVALIKAVMMQESGGQGGDPMQCSACGYNTRGGTITDPDYSIEVGIQYLRDCLNAAGATGAGDLAAIKLALQGYNYGGGYITWAKKNYGGYSEANAKEFAEKQKQKLGWKSYGDPLYVPHVLRYYTV